MINYEKFIDKETNFLFNEATLNMEKEQVSGGLVKLHSLLVDYQYNFRVLHWKTVSNNFDGTHALMAEYYTKLEEFLDSVAEILLILDINPVSLEECAKVNDVDCDPNKDYTRKECIEKTNEMLNNLVSAINNAQKGLPEDMQDELKQMQFYIRKEVEYKGKARAKQAGGL